MIHLTITPPATPPADASFSTFAQQIEDFVSGVLTLDPEQALLRAGLSFLVVIGAALIIWGLRLLLKGLTERIAPKEDGAPRRRVHIGRWTMRVARLAIFAGALIVILRLWGFDFSDLRGSPIYALFSALGRIAIILVLALGAIELGQLGINRAFDRVAARARNPRRSAQIRTLGPVLAGLVTTVVVIIAAMMALSEVGVEIGPLLAGAGIVGLAVGFGAQTIVKDFLTGLFLIMEDSVSIGDVVRIGEFSGGVEAMSLRTIKLRDFNGTLHIFPYSEAQVIHNMTKDFSFAVFEFPIDHTSDVGKALELMKEIGDELREESAFVGAIVSPIEVAGVDRVSESGVLLKARIKTAPGKQWSVQREYLRRIRLAFERERIEFTQTTSRLIMPELDVKQT
ncbi:MAG: mechanosensitive ion channel family protein [Hyphomonadaceae bacterium]